MPFKTALLIASADGGILRVSLLPHLRLVRGLFAFLLGPVMPPAKR